jgi:hypothetical protein
MFERGERPTKKNLDTTQRRWSCLTHPVSAIELLEMIVGPKSSANHNHPDEAIPSPKITIGFGFPVVFGFELTQFSTILGRFPASFHWGGYMGRATEHLAEKLGAGMGELCQIQKRRRTYHRGSPRKLGGRGEGLPSSIINTLVFRSLECFWLQVPKAEIQSHAAALDLLCLR